MSERGKAVDYGAELENLYKRWDYLYEHGGSDPFWSDGTNLSLLRTHIINCKINSHQHGNLRQRNPIGALESQK